MAYFLIYSNALTCIALVKTSGYQRGLLYVMMHTLVHCQLLLQIIDHNDQIIPACDSKNMIKGKCCTGKCPFGQESSFPNKCSSLLQNLFLKIPWNLLFTLTSSIPCSFSLFSCLRHGSLCLTRYVLQAAVFSAFHHLHVSLIVVYFFSIIRHSSVYELRVTSCISQR